MNEPYGRLIELEMGYSVAEFVRVLPAAMRDWRVEGDTGDWRVLQSDGQCVARIAVSPRKPRVIGALRIPVLAVSITIIATEELLAEAFLQRFERGFHRGGG